MKTYQLEMVSIFPSTVEKITNPNHAAPMPNNPGAIAVFEAVWAALMGPTAIADVDAAIDNVEFDVQQESVETMKAGARTTATGILQGQNWVIGLANVAVDQFYQPTNNGHEIVSKLVNTALSGSPNIKYPLNVGQEVKTCYMYIHLRMKPKPP